MVRKYKQSFYEIVTDDGYDVVVTRKTEHGARNYRQIMIKRYGWSPNELSIYKHWWDKNLRMWKGEDII